MEGSIRRVYLNAYDSIEAQDLMARLTTAGTLGGSLTNRGSPNSRVTRGQLVFVCKRRLYRRRTKIKG
jgi:hypothetical protein